MKKIEVLFSPAEFEALPRRNLSQSICIVFDILRATSTMITALANGAAAVIPVASIEEALAYARPDVLLAGEREGFRITSRLTGSVDFDLGNSPREFTRERVASKTIVMTTTNGTRALQACRGASETLAGSFLNLGAVARRIRERNPDELLLVCSGTNDEAALEDALAAGGLAELLWPVFGDAHVADSARIARTLFQQARSDLPGALSQARNGQRLLGIAELRDDVTYCLQRDIVDLNAHLEVETLRRGVALRIAR
ncbi:MAG TPA: 2-phosphosulfolactate phosphatase [Verrucomicrobiae bacterium]|jgi:2-phosphosulfolactate phosphatase|nr:2-phosphosulfolactate phosphatase [Verrucomicrobiae bacterium]